MKRILAYILSISLILLPMPPMVQAEETQVVVASGTIAANVLKASLVDGGATASGGAFADFTALTVTDTVPVASGTVTQANTRIATVATGALLELVGVDLSAHIGRKIVIRSGGKRLEGYIGAAGGETLSSNLILNNADFASDEPPGTAWTRGTGWTISGGVAVASTTGLVGLNQTIATVSGGLYKGGFTLVSRTSGGFALYTNGAANSYTGYKTVPGTYSGYLNVTSNTQTLFASTAVGSVDDPFVQRVTDLASTGAKIYTTSALSTQSWAYQDTGYDPNAAAGVTYEIYSVTPLTNHLGHLLRVKSLTSGQVLQGYIKAAGTGETVGSNLVTSWTNNSGEYETLTSSGADITSAINTSGVGRAYTNNIAALGSLTKTNATLTLNSGEAPILRTRNTVGGTNGSFSVTLPAGASEYYFSKGSAANDLILSVANSIAANWSLVLLHKQVLTPSNTGCTITSLKGGSLYNWSQKPTTLSTFLNDAAGYSYEIVKVLDAPVVSGPTAIAAGAALIDSTTANAFYGGADLDCTNYQDGRHLAHFTDSSGQVAVAWISATAPSGEALTQKATDPDFTGDGSAWTIIGGGAFSYDAVNNEMDATAAAAANSFNQSIATTAGALYKSSITVNNYTSGNVRQTFVSSGAWLGSATSESIYRNATSTSTLVVTEGRSIAFTGSVNIRNVWQLTMPRAEGALLLSARGGSRGWMIKSATWDPNKAQTLRILYYGD